MPVPSRPTPETENRRTHAPRLARLAGWLCSLLASSELCAQSVLFIDPGKGDENYWLTATRAMQAAAVSLGVRLEVIHAQRDHLRALGIAREVADRPPEKRPDYVIFSNDYGTGPEILRILDQAGIKTFVAFSGISLPAERALTGRPRERYTHWLGSLEPRAEEAGYESAKALIDKARQAKAFARDGKLHLLVLAGDRSTPSSIKRNIGMQRAVADAGDVVIDQQVYADWSRDKAVVKSRWLYLRYPEARLVWSGSDQIALGAMQSLVAKGGTPGKTLFFSGINTSPEAMEAFRTGQLSSLSGGHFIAGAWALVMLYDYDHGRDFKDEGLEMEYSMFMQFTPANAARFVKLYGKQDFSRIKFREASKVLNPARHHYDFRFSPLMR